MSGKDKVVYMIQKELNKYAEYSCSLPTGQSLGKKWVRNQSFLLPADHPKKHIGDWWLGEYVPDPDPKMIGVRWVPIEVVDVWGKVDYKPGKVLV